MPRFVHGNIKHTMPYNKRKHDIGVLRSMRARRKGRTTFIIGNEIEVLTSKTAWTALMRQVRGRSYCMKSETPITKIGAYWKLEGSPEIRLRHHGKIATSPNRYTSILKAHHASNKLAVMGTHRVSGGWHKGFKANKPWRRMQWAKHDAMDIQDIATFHDEGYNVIFDGDLNRMHLKATHFHPDAVMVMYHGLDYMVAIPAPGYKVVVSNREVIGDHELFTDHPFLAADVNFVKA